MSTSTPHSQAVAQVQCVHREVRWAPFDRSADTWRCVDCCMEFGPVEAQDAVNFARSEAENERLRSRIAGLEEQLRCCLNQAHTDTLRGRIAELPAGEGQVPCACDAPVGVRPVQCHRHQIVRVRP